MIKKHIGYILCGLGNLCLTLGDKLCTMGEKYKNG